MSPERFHEITSRYRSLRLAVVGDYCLDRYMEIDPAREEVSIETGLPVHNVVNVRAQPGGSGTILANLVALGIGELHPVGFCGDDGEGYELRKALTALPGVQMDAFLQTAERRTFTYCKPLRVTAGEPPEELRRLDSKNWSPTPAAFQRSLAASVLGLSERIDGIILLEQTDQPETGVVTRTVRDAVHEALRHRPELLVIADSRLGLRDFPPVMLKMNVAELCALLGEKPSLPLEQVAACATQLAQRQGQPVFITLSEHGMIGADAAGAVEQVHALPIRGPIDIVGAGDSVTANLLAAKAGGATLREAMEIAMTAASIVVHQLSTTGTATIDGIRALMSWPAGDA